MSEGFVIDTPGGMWMFQLVQWRSALGLAIKSTNGMVAARHLTPKAIIVHLYEYGITEETGLPRATKAVQRRAYKDLDDYIVANGGESRAL